MGRAPCCEKVGLKKGRWTAEEDEKLLNYIRQNGEGSWRSLPKNAGLLRCGKSCRLRWINYLRSDLKRGNITPQEEETIIKLHSVMGNRWSLIAGQLPGRTDNEIKNYWNSHLSRKIHTFIRPPNYNGGKMVINMAHATATPKRRGGRTSRAAMQRSRSTNNTTSSTSYHNRNPLLVLNNKNDNNNSTNNNNNNNNNSNVTPVVAVAIPPTPETKDKKENNGNVDDRATCQKESEDELQELLGIEDIIELDGLVSISTDRSNCSMNQVGSSGSMHVEMRPTDHHSSFTTTSNGGYSTSSSSSYCDHQVRDWAWDWDWDWEIGKVGVQEQEIEWGEKEQIISWLWENDDDNSNFKLLEDYHSNITNNYDADLIGLPDAEVVDSEKEQAMLTWPLSSLS